MIPLSERIGHDDIAREATRKGFGRGLKRAGLADKNVVALCADLTESTQMLAFKESFPDRFVQVGVAEQNLVTLASGMSAVGKIPFAASYAAFSPGRNWEQIRTTICLNDRMVCIVGSHAGVNVGADGATHQMLEDIALMRCLPNMVVIAPGDSKEAEKATRAIAAQTSPVYLRLAREDSAVFTTDETPFEIGKAYVLREGSDLSLLGTGTMTYHCLMAAQILSESGVNAEVVHVPTIKPLDQETIVASLHKTGRGITVEEAQRAGGFGSAVAELMSERLPLPLRRIGIDDTFGCSGTAQELFEHFGLMPQQIATTAQEFIHNMPQYHR